MEPNVRILDRMTETPTRIFLAEDNEGDVFLVRLALEKRGLSYDLIVANNGEAALSLLDQAEKGVTRAPELILLDLNLPKMNGNLVLSYIRHSPTFSGTPVIVLTSSDSPKDRESAFSLGANLYFRKPTDLHAFLQLGDVIQETLHHNLSA